MTSYLTTGQISLRVGVCEESVRNWIESGELVGVNVATTGSTKKRWRVTEEALAAFLESRATTPRAKTVPRAKLETVPEYV